MAANTILVIEDDPRIQKALHRQFTTEGYEVHLAGDGEQGLASCKSLKPAGVVLDLMLPTMSGLEVCKGIKKWSPTMPVVVLSAVSEVADKVLLLEMGADDYVTKPFSPRELMARVQAAIRRAQRPAVNDRVTFGNIAADFSGMEVFKDGESVSLTAHEIKLLQYFVENPERVITREELLNDVWHYTSYPTTRTVDNHVMKLRQKLEPDPAKPIYFRTLHGIGYKFVRGD
ncbi:response regulator transcription factor [Edaphobacter bradus]|uniref:response regulator transcription factor n=1 Tax=Edaphobacter bradus TaxID=2259016 RepID=UPI0021E04875|nr:response regulator transcription factor [Edaphobacter bradus]